MQRDILALGNKESGKDQVTDTTFELQIIASIQSTHQDIKDGKKIARVRVDRHTRTIEAVRETSIFSTKEKKRIGWARVFERCMHTPRRILSPCIAHSKKTILSVGKCFVNTRRRGVSKKRKKPMDVTALETQTLPVHYWLETWLVLLTFAIFACAL